MKPHHMLVERKMHPLVADDNGLWVTVNICPNRSLGQNLPTNMWMDKEMWYILMTEYYWIIRRKKTTFARKWVNLVSLG